MMVKMVLNLRYTYNLTRASNMKKVTMLLTRSLNNLDNKKNLRKGLGEKYLYLTKYDFKKFGFKKLNNFQ